jgi:hypothetical protein
VTLSGTPTLDSLTLQTVSIGSYKKYGFHSRAPHTTISDVSDSGDTDVHYRTVVIHNTYDTTIADFTMRLGTVEFRETPSSINTDKKSTLDEVVSCTAQWGSPVKKLFFSCHTIFPPVKISFKKLSDTSYMAMVHGGVRAHRPGSYELRPHGLPRILPGDSLRLQFAFRVTDNETPRPQALHDLYTKFRAHHQPRIHWPDRRPIGAIFLPSSGHISDSNPRGWFDDPDLNVFSDSGRAEFKRRMLQFAENSVSTLRGMNAQGMIVWNVEGAENPHPITYIGDPRMLPIMAPEMHDIADEFFQMFRNAGLRTGVCIRPTQVYRKSDSSWSHGTGSHNPDKRNPLNDDFSDIWPDDVPWWKFYPVVERIDKKISYAKQRWGCSLFYFDTDRLWRQFGENQEFQSVPLQSCMYRRIRKRHPDVLMIPETQGRRAAYAYTAYYLQPPYSSNITPTDVKDLLPYAFSVSYTVNLSKDEWNNRRPSFVQGVSNGDILFFRGWFGCSYNDLVKEVYDEVYDSAAINPGLSPDYYPADGTEPGFPPGYDSGRVNSASIPYSPSANGVKHPSERHFAYTTRLTNTKLIVSLYEDGMYRFRLTNTAGRGVDGFSAEGPCRRRVDISSCAKGVYIVNVSTPEGTKTHRLILR